MLKSVVIFAALSRLSPWTNLLSSRMLPSERLLDLPDRFISSNLVYSSNLVIALRTQHLETYSCFEIFDKLRPDWYKANGLSTNVRFNGSFTHKTLKNESKKRIKTIFETNDACLKSYLVPLDNKTNEGSKSVLNF